MNISSNYYQNWIADFTGNVVNDSLLISGVSGDLAVSYHILDSSPKRERVAIFGGVKNNLVRVINNGEEYLFIDQATFANVYVRLAERTYHTGEFYYHFNGPMEGSYGLGLSLSVQPYNDSLSGSFFGTHVYYGVNLMASAGLPDFVYFRYNSMLRSTRAQILLQRKKRLDGEIGVLMSDQFGIELNPVYERVDDLYYFDENALVNVDSVGVNRICLALKVDYNPEHLLFSSVIKWQRVGGSSVVSLPEWVMTSTLGYRWSMFSNNLGCRLAIKGMYFSEYYARGYLPFYDAWYLQSSRLYGNYVQVDLQSTFTIKSVDLGLDVVNASYGFVGSGPLVGPNYPAVPRFVRFNISWKFIN
ncbi:MAG: hypothetical protein Kow0075_07530 [Salibacteraceae bacterium]